MHSATPLNEVDMLTKFYNASMCSDWPIPTPSKTVGADAMGHGWARAGEVSLFYLFIYY